VGWCSVSILGGFEVRIGGKPIPGDAWRSRRAADVVKLLALVPSHSLHREQLMEALWPNLSSDAAGANLRKAVHYARRAMGGDEAIVSSGSVLSLWGGHADVDAQAFLKAADSAVASHEEGACAHAADLYRGDLLPADRFEEWASAPRASLRERYRAVLKGAGRHQHVLDLDPTDEESHRALMRGYFEAGRRREAMRQFELLREALREHVGVGPDPETIALYERVLDMEPDEPPTPTQRAAVLISTGLVHLSRGDFAEAERHARQAKAMAMDAGLGHELGEAATLLALVSFFTERWYDVFYEEFTASLRHNADSTLAVWDANVLTSAASWTRVSL